MTPEPRPNPDNDDPCDGEMLTACDSGRSEDCTGVPTRTRAVPYLREPLHLCAPCDVYEARQAENGEPDPLRTPGVEGGCSFDYLRR